MNRRCVYNALCISCKDCFNASRTHQSLTVTATDGDDGEEEEEEDTQMLDDEEMQELMGNREYLESVLSSLPGVNPEEALQNLEQMRQAVQQQGDQEKEEEVKTNTHTHTHVRNMIV